jgi:hypothetical protein
VLKKAFIVLGIFIFLLLLIKVNINHTIQGEKMKIENVDEWTKEIMYLTTLDVHNNEEDSRFGELLDMTDSGTDDKKVVRSLMKILFINDEIGWDETIYNNLGLVSYKLYYEVLFELMIYLDNDKGMFLGLYMLENYSGDVYTKEQWEEIYNIAWEKLDQVTIKRILEYYEKNSPYTDYDDYPFFEFKLLFERLIKEKYPNHE